MLTTASTLLDQEEELYKLVSSSKSGRHSMEVIMKKTDRRAIVDEIEMHEDVLIEEFHTHLQLEMKMQDEAGHQREEAGRQHDEEMMREMKMHEEEMLREMKLLHVELLVVTLACIGISIGALLYLKK
eukprot:541572-Ditylum_brightwellii.AAC.1